MQWYSPFRRINSGTRFGHTPAALRCPVVTWRRSLPLGLGLRLRRVERRLCWVLRLRRVGRRLCGGLRLPGVPHARCGLREKRMVQFGGWSVTHVSYLPLHISFSADGLHVSFSADGLLHMSPICRCTGPFRQIVCTCPFRRMVCYTLHSWGCLTPPKRARIALGEQGRRPFPWLVCTTATCACFAALGPSITSLPNSAPICPFRRMIRGAHNMSFWRLHILADGLHMLCFWRMVCTGHYSNGANPAPCTLHCLRPDGIPYMLGCPCGTSALKLFGLICGPCHQKGERLHTGTGQEHNSYPCLPLP